VIKSMNLGTATRWGLNLIGLLAAIIALHLGQSIFIPTIIALLLAAMLWPVVRWLNQRLRMSWGFACMVAVSGLIVLNVLLTLGFFLAIPKILQDMPDLRDEEGQREVYTKLRDQIGMMAPLDDFYLPPDPEKSRVFLYVKRALNESPYLPEALWKTAYYSNMWLWQWVLIIFILIFMLVEGPMLTRRFVDIFGPNERTKGKAVHALSDMAHHVRTYLVWRTIINFAVALAVGLVYRYLFHLRQPWPWAILTAVLFYVPYIGPLAAGVLPVLDAFITVSPWAALGVMFVYAVIITLEGYVLVPVVMGHTMELNATTVMLACLFWDLVWGLPGLFLAMPLMAALKAVCTTVPDWQPLANLMSTAKTEVHYVPSMPDIVLPALDQTELLSPEDVQGTRKGRPSVGEAR
jgi:predicted PurR-regulated permease PerM